MSRFQSLGWHPEGRVVRSVDNPGEKGVRVMNSSANSSPMVAVEDPLAGITLPQDPTLRELFLHKLRSAPASTLPVLAQSNKLAPQNTDSAPDNTNGSGRGLLAAIVKALSDMAASQPRNRGWGD